MQLVAGGRPVGGGVGGGAQSASAPARPVAGRHKAHRTSVTGCTLTRNLYYLESARRGDEKPSGSFTSSKTGEAGATRCTFRKPNKNQTRKETESGYTIHGANSTSTSAAKNVTSSLERARPVLGLYRYFCQRRTSGARRRSAGDRPFGGLKGPGPVLTGRPGPRLLEFVKLALIPLPGGGARGRRGGGHRCGICGSDLHFGQAVMGTPGNRCSVTMG